MPTLWPYCPTETFSEGLSWRSDVIRAYSTEQRIRLTEVPRRVFNISHLLNQRKYERAKQLVMGVGGGTWYLPLWHERQRVSVSYGSGTITVDTTSCEYVNGGYACLWTSDELCEVVLIGTVAAGSLTLSGATSRAYTDAFVMPAVVASNPYGIEAVRSVNSVVAVSAEWSVYAGTDIGASTYPTYRGYPAVTDCVRIGSGTISESVSCPVDVVDNGFSDPFIDAQQSTVRRSLNLSWMATDLDQLRSVREWLHYIKGSQSAYWVPDWTSGIELLANVSPSDTTITIRQILLDNIAEAGDLVIMVGSTHYRFQFTSVSTVGSAEVLTLSAPAGVSIAMADVSRACLLRLCRSVSDRVEFSHRYRGNDRQLSACQVIAQEVPVI